MCFTIPPGAINTVPLLPKTAQPACLPPALTSKHSRSCSTGPYMTAAAGPGWLKCSAGPSVTPTLAHKCLLKQGSDKNIMNKPSNSKERYGTLQPALLLVLSDITLGQQHSYPLQGKAGRSKKSFQHFDKRLYFLSLRHAIVYWLDFGENQGEEPKGYDLLHIERKYNEELLPTYKTPWQKLSLI